MMKVLIAYDGSDGANAALEDLKHAGLDGDIEAVVMTVAEVFVPPPINEQVDNTFPLYVPDGVKRAHKRAKEKLAEAAALAQSALNKTRLLFPEWRVSHQVEADSPAWALIKKADEWRPDLVVLGARGHSVFGGRLILGSISQRVLYEARCSVRIGRGWNKNPDKPVRLLIAVDGSSDAQLAVEAVCKRHWPKGTEAALLTVVDTVMEVTPDRSKPAATKWIEVADENNWNEVREMFEPLAEELRSAGLHAEILVRRGNPADEILQEAQTWGADCIFAGARGMRGVDRLLLGSISAAVSSRAHCSVEVVRAS